MVPDYDLLNTGLKTDPYTSKKVIYRHKLPQPGVFSSPFEYINRLSSIVIPFYVTPL
jgi:hypothetical protein